MDHIYKITNTVNNKSYVGYTTNPTARWEAHRHNQGSKLVFQAIKKYGEDKFTFEVIAEDTVDNEQKYIDEHNTMAPYGYNLVEGGGLPPKPYGSYIEMYGNNDKAEKFRQKQLEQGGFGPTMHTEETKRKISMNNARAMQGKKHKASTLKLISEARRGVHQGAGNPNAKQFELTSPQGKVYTCIGNLKTMCEQLGLSFATVRASLQFNRPMRSGWRVKKC